jgi:hypothetical protein
MSKAIAAKLIQRFKTQLRGVASRTLLDEQKRYFRPGKNVKEGSKGLGIIGNHATINTNILVSDGEKRHIAIALVQLSRTIAKKGSLDFVDLHGKMNPIEMKLKGKANWDSTMISFKSTSATVSTGIDTWTRNDSQPQADAIHSFFECPNCPHVEYSSCKAFQIFDIDIKQKCNVCTKSTSVKF